MFDYLLYFDYINQNYGNEEFDLLMKDTFMVIQNYTKLINISIPLYSLLIEAISFFKEQIVYNKNFDICIAYFDENEKTEKFINSLCINNEYPHNWIIWAKIIPEKGNIDASIIRNGFDTQIVINPEFITWKIYMVIEPIEM